MIDFQETECASIFNITHKTVEYDCSRLLVRLIQHCLESQYFSVLTTESKPKRKEFDGQMKL